MAESTAKTKNTQGEGNYKETVESILVAFILAFIFRAFVVEAFVIPTGSMAPTLFGAHMRFTCPDCGYTFDVGYRAPKSENGDDIDIPSDPVNRPPNVRCPNCAYDFPTQDAMSRTILQPVRFGDRILVLKYLYLFQEPRRWDVVVFKSPSEEKHIPEDPEYSQNFIKRLIGKPTESIVILDGNIFVGGADSKGVETVTNGFKVAPDADAFKIQRKPSYVQDRLWRIVYDNDFVPNGHDSARTTTWHQPWQVSDGTGWDQGTNGLSRRFNFNNANGTSTLFFNPEANRDINSLTDWIAYDQLDDLHSRDRPWVSDLKLSCTYTRKSGDGPLRLYLTKFDHCFVAEITPGKVSLYESKLASPSDESTGKGFDPGAMVLLDSKSMPELGGSAPARIDFMNYDYRVTLRINGVEAFAPHDYDPQVSNLWQHALDNEHEPMSRPEIRISADHQVGTIEHVSLWHDIYYGNRGEVRDSQGNSRFSFWASPQNVMHLGKAEYFVLGDNSLISGDARYWGDPIILPHEGLPNTEGGRVPESFMLGKAFLVYWPAGYPLPFIGIKGVPDFGEMRFIR